MGLIALVLGIILVLVDTKLNKESIYLKYLPGYNCGACGYAGCTGMADALEKDKEAYKEVTYYENDKYNIIHYYKNENSHNFRYTNEYYSAYVINEKGTKIFYYILASELSCKKDNNYKEVDKILKSIKINGEEWNI